MLSAIWVVHRDAYKGVRSVQVAPRILHITIHVMAASAGHGQGELKVVEHREADPFTLQH